MDDKTFKSLKNDPECVNDLYKFICLTNVEVGHVSVVNSPNGHGILKKDQVEWPRQIVADLK